MSGSDDNYVGLLLEQIRDQNKAVLEYVAEMPKVLDCQSLDSQATLR
jgi:hypothetical protein